MHLAGKTDEARADLARLALIKKQREDAAKKREEERKGVYAVRQQTSLHLGCSVLVSYFAFLISPVLFLSVQVFFKPVIFLLFPFPSSCVCFFCFYWYYFNAFPNPSVAFPLFPSLTVDHASSQKGLGKAQPPREFA